MVYGVEGLGDVQKYYSYLFLVIKSFVPLIKTVKKKIEFEWNEQNISV